MTFTHLNYKMRLLIKSTAIVFSLLAILALTAAKLSSSKDFTYYCNGKYVTESVAELLKKEIDLGKDSWRANPACVAAVSAPYLRPPVVRGEVPKWSSGEVDGRQRVSVVTKSWNACYDIESQSLGKAVVQMSIDNNPYCCFTLEKPTGNHWYITRIDDISHNGAGPNIANAVHLVPLRLVLKRNGLVMKWNPKTKEAEIKGPMISCNLQVGYDVVEINGKQFTTKASPTLIKGTLYAADDLVSEIIALGLTLAAVR